MKNENDKAQVDFKILSEKVIKIERKPGEKSIGQLMVEALNNPANHGKTR